MFSSVLAAVAALFAITNPIGAVPVFLEITESEKAARRRSDAGRASLIVFAILAAAAAGGGYVLRFLGISVNSLRAAGGLIILVMAFEMLSGSTTRLQSHSGGPDEDPTAKDSLAVPFAMPLVAGPGAITTVIALTARSDRVAALLEVLVATAVVSLILYASLLASSYLGDKISPRGYAILLRFLGLLLAAIGVQYALEGAKAVLVATTG